MKTIKICAFFVMIASFSWAADWETYDLIDRLLTIREPSAPVIHGDFVIFTAASSLRRMGVAFAHESFSDIHWYTQLAVSQDRMNMIILPGEKFPSPYKDSGLQFFVLQVPDYLREVEYRLVINGLWTIDPANPKFRRDPVSGLSMSVVSMPLRPANYNPMNGLPEGLDFNFFGPPGETVTVAGSFNGWDPFMYELREGPAGHYSLKIPLPPGIYQYVFFHRGQRFTDPHNPRRSYARDGSAASEVVIPR
jgi:hypothetical protein